jgi:helicase required for RNAi-mediated heterochromatin assembly 1
MNVPFDYNIDKSQQNQGGDDITLPYNIINGPWQTKEQYVAAHYQLLREDGVAPLRNAVDSFKAQPDMMDSGDTCIYTQVG